MIAATFTLDELRAAVHGLQTGTHPAPATTQGMVELPSEGPLIAVMGVGGGVGATVTALAIAETTKAAKLVELSQPWATGLAEATTSELGTRHGWRLGNRDRLRIERRHEPTAAIQESPGLTVVDIGAWNGDTPPARQGAPLVVVARCNIPSLRRLSNMLETLPAPPAVAVVVGGPARSWPKAVAAALSPTLRAALADGLIHPVPECSGLRYCGITGQALPKPLLVAVSRFIPDLEVESQC